MSLEAVVVQDWWNSIAYAMPLSSTLQARDLWENIAASIAADTDPVRTATGLWIGEAADYDYDSPVGGEFRASVIILTCLTRC